MITNAQEELQEAQTERQAQLQIVQKWGRAIGRGGKTGFVAIPETLLRGQTRLGISATEMMVLINVLMHWWYHDRPPFPGNRRIAQRMGVSARTVQRAFETLEKKGLVRRNVMAFTEDGRSDSEAVEPAGSTGEQKKTPYSSVRYLDLSGLVLRLEAIADDLRGYEGK